MASLRELQRAFAAALRDPGAVCPVVPPLNLSIYRNNSAHAFRGALEASFPVIRARVGDDYFRQLAHLYRNAFPSRSGDLHFAGESFSDFLGDHLRDGEYAWLADLARLEWLLQEALISPELPPLEAAELARFDSGDLGDLVFTFQPSLRLHASAYPVYSVWLANQGTHAPPVDQSHGSEQGLIHLRHTSAGVQRVDASLFSYMSALAAGSTLADSMGSSGLDEAALLSALAFTFGEGLVVGIALKAERAAP